MVSSQGSNHTQNHLKVTPPCRRYTVEVRQLNRSINKVVTQLFPSIIVLGVSTNFILATILKILNTTEKL